MSDYFYEITHSLPEISTLGDWIIDPSTILKKEIKINQNGFDTETIAREVLKWSKDGKSNQDRIIEKYSYAERQKYLNLTPDGKLISFKVKENNLLLKTGTSLVLPNSNVDRFSLLTEGIQIASVSERTFKAQKLAELEADKGYISVTKPQNGFLQLGDLKTSAPSMTVWMWCRALSDNKENTGQELKGQIIDLTSFVQTINTSVTKNGGNFQITLPPLVCENRDGVWVLKKSSIQQTISQVSGKKEFLAQDSLFKNIDESGSVRNQFFFHRIISPNDLIFIRFDALKNEEKQRLEDSLNFAISNRSLPNRIYDMIGLVDSNSFTISPENNDVSIRITGRDLSKLFIDDGAYFYALEQTQGVGYVGGNASRQGEEGLAKRVLIDGQLQFEYVSLYFWNPISKILQFIIQQLSTIKVVPDELFEAYSNRNTKSSFTEQNKAAQETDLQQKTIIKLIKQIRKTNGLILDSQKEDSEAILIQAKLTAFLKGIRSQTVRLTQNNRTVGWSKHLFESNYIAQNKLPGYFNNSLKTKPFNQLIELNEDLLIYELINQIDIQIDKEISAKTLKKKTSKAEIVPQEQINTKTVSGIWQIINLIIDESVSNRRIVDASISSSSGSLLNFIRKACQEPFVEVLMDTYGDRYYLTVRRPPYNEEGIRSLLDGSISSEKGVSNATPVIIDVEESDVLQEILSSDDTQAYSWYRFSPQQSFIGGLANYSTAYIPAVYFPEYADIWGSRALETVSNYFTYLPLDLKQNSQLDVIETQAFIDLKFIIDTNAYLPFTRRGSIVINRDRRMKVGNLFRYKPTGEIFLIDGVTHAHSISENGMVDATTTLQVSRGMVEQLIYGVKVPGITELVSYFNIIGTRLNFNKKIVEVKESESVRNPKYKEAQIQAGINDALTNNIIESHETQDGFGVIFNNQATPLTKPKKLNPIVELQLRKLQPDVQTKFRELFYKIQELGYSVVMRSGNAVSVRTKQDQVNTILKNPQFYSSDIIAKAKAGDVDSFTEAPHVKGIALDINLINATTNKQYTSATPIADWLLTRVPMLAASMGFKWGGAFAKSDPVHFAYDGKIKDISPQEPEFITNTKTVKKEIYDSGAVLKNFKVNKAVFNFFLKQQQFNYSNTTVQKTIKSA